MATLEQRRAQIAYRHIEEVKAKGDDCQKKYGSMVHAMPALLRSAGLCQALHFVQSRSDETQKLLLDHLACQLNRIFSAKQMDGERLLDKVRNASLPDYLHLTQETLRVIDWYRRFVQGVLKVEPGNDSQ